MEKDFIEKLYNILKDIIIPENEYDLENNYKNYLMKSYSGAIDEKANLDDLMSFFVNIEIKKWSGLDIQKMCELIIVDSKYNRMKHLHDLISENSLLKSNNSEDEIKYTDVYFAFIEMEELLESVLDFNKTKAQIMYMHSLNDYNVLFEEKKEPISI